MEQSHHLQPAEADDFSIRNLEELFAAQEASSRIMAIMLAAVARSRWSWVASAS